MTRVAVPEHLDTDAGFAGVGRRLSRIPRSGADVADRRAAAVRQQRCVRARGEELLPCEGTQPNASCTAGGSGPNIYTTRSERAHDRARPGGEHLDGVRAGRDEVGVFCRWRPGAQSAIRRRPSSKMVPLAAAIGDGHRLDDTVSYSYSQRCPPVCWPASISYNGVEIKLIRQAAAAGAGDTAGDSGKGLVELRGFLKRIEIWGERGQAARLCAAIRDLRYPGCVGWPPYRPSAMTGRWRRTGRSVRHCRCRHGTSLILVCNWY